VMPQKFPKLQCPWSVMRLKLDEMIPVHVEAERSLKGVAVPGSQLNRKLFETNVANRLARFVQPVGYGVSLSALANLPRFLETVCFPV